MFGRRKIYTDENIITRSNVRDVLAEMLGTHEKNRLEIDYLYRYYKGEQPILKRTKMVRAEITNKIVENRANEIVTFKTGYLVGEPIQYVSYVSDERIVNSIQALNSYMRSENKAREDKRLCDWMHICGTAYRMILPDEMSNQLEDEAPFEIYTPDPRNCFVGYHNDVGETPAMAVRYVKKRDKTIYDIYTEDHFFEIDNSGNFLRDEPLAIGIPIIEYPANEARLGSFETVLTLLDALNLVDSNRLDSLEQFVQALLLMHNINIKEDDFPKLKQLQREGMILFSDIAPEMKGEVKYLVQELNQIQTQNLMDHYYDAILTIVGMPNRNGGTSTSDTGTAVIFRDGWSAAEARAKDTENMFKPSEKEFLKVVIKICKKLTALDLKLSDIDIRFTRRNYENIAQKSSVLVTMLNNEKIAPQLAFSHSGMFADPEAAYAMSKAYWEEQTKKEVIDLAQIAGIRADVSGKGGTSDDNEDNV